MIEVKKLSKVYGKKESIFTALDSVSFSVPDGATVAIIGKSGSGKSTLALELQQRLFAKGYHTYVLDGDNIRHGLCGDLGFSDVDRVENIRRIGEVAKLFVDAGTIVLTAFISPFRSERRMVRELVGTSEFVEIFIDTPLANAAHRELREIGRAHV